MKTFYLNDQKKEVFFSGLASLLTSGVGFSRSFELLIAGEKEKKTRKLYTEIYGQVVRGATLWRGMEDSGRFASLDTGVVRIGEETGKLDYSLHFLTDYYRKQIARKRMIRGAVSYPLIILVAAVVVLVFMMTVIVPMFEQVYSRMGGELPEITRTMITLSRNFPLYLAVGGGIISCLILSTLLWGRTDTFQALWSSLLLHLPLAGVLLKKNYQAQFCKLLHLLYSSGVPLLKAISMLERVIIFYPYRKSFPQICSGLQRGEFFADNMAHFPTIYDLKLITLLRVGEETNRLGDMLDRQGESLTQELEHRIRQLGNMLEPVLILGIGALVALVLISMYLPMFRLGNTIY